MKNRKKIINGIKKKEIKQKKYKNFDYKEHCFCILLALGIQPVDAYKKTFEDAFKLTSKEIESKANKLLTKHKDFIVKCTKKSFDIGSVEWVRNQLLLELLDQEKQLDFRERIEIYRTIISLFKIDIDARRVDIQIAVEKERLKKMRIENAKDVNAFVQEKEDGAIEKVEIDKMDDKTKKQLLKDFWGSNNE